MSRALTALTLALLCAACSSLSRKQCEAGDWHAVGRVDALRGLGLERTREHAEACRGVATVDEREYRAGWEEGRREYCAPANAFSLGRYQAPVLGGCANEAEFNAQYAKGVLLGRKLGELGDLEKRIDQESDRAARDQSVVNHVAQAYNLLSGRSPTRELDERAARLRDEINGLEAGAPPASVTTTELRLGTVRDWGGAFVGTFGGFGLGHAIQGRYARDGWKWTLGEVAAITAMGVATSSTCGENGDCRGAWVPVSLLAWLGFRVWQGADVLTYAAHAPYERR